MTNDLRARMDALFDGSEPPIAVDARAAVQGARAVRRRRSIGVTSMAAVAVAAIVAGTVVVGDVRQREPLPVIPADGRLTTVEHLQNAIDPTPDLGPLGRDSNAVMRSTVGHFTDQPYDGGNVTGADGSTAEATTVVDLQYTDGVIIRFAVDELATTPDVRSFECAGQGRLLGIDRLEPGTDIGVTCDESGVLLAEREGAYVAGQLVIGRYAVTVLASRLAAPPSRGDVVAATSDLVERLDWYDAAPADPDPTGERLMTQEDFEAAVEPTADGIRARREVMSIMRSVATDLGLDNIDSSMAGAQSPRRDENSEEHLWAMSRGDSNLLIVLSQRFGSTDSRPFDCSDDSWPREDGRPGDYLEHDGVGTVGCDPSGVVITEVPVGEEYPAQIGGRLMIGSYIVSINASQVQPLPSRQAVIDATLSLTRLMYWYEAGSSMLTAEPARLAAAADFADAVDPRPEPAYLQRDWQTISDAAAQVFDAGEYNSTVYVDGMTPGDPFSGGRFTYGLSDARFEIDVVGPDPKAGSPRRECPSSRPETVTCTEFGVLETVVEPYQGVDDGLTRSTLHVGDFRIIVKSFASTDGSTAPDRETVEDAVMTVHDLIYWVDAGV